ncbi:adhesion G-protein coupled receptor g6 [Plakobranchus ocellatus]|uniref:Adhesion G-protein coupled receptor g6 n=1 Tax=Plakobranchus ocellatus TaxID=259542 RepID=A0AAV4D061_9GAST|nr:adhesion G-protein coupled receptor g6 [Plakobranchus ocellatus]
MKIVPITVKLGLQLITILALLQPSLVNPSYDANEVFSIASESKDQWGDALSKNRMDTKTRLKPGKGSTEEDFKQNKAPKNEPLGEKAARSPFELFKTRQKRETSSTAKPDLQAGADKEQHGKPSLTQLVEGKKNLPSRSLKPAQVTGTSRRFTLTAPQSLRNSEKKFQKEHAALNISGVLPTLIKPKILIIDSKILNPVDELQPVLVIKDNEFVARKSSILDVFYSSEEQYWSIVARAYTSVCKTTCESRSTKPLCTKCWCDSACLLYGDCCPEIYLKNGYSPPLSKQDQNCEAVTFSNARKKDKPERYRMIKSCSAHSWITDIEKNFELQTRMQNKMDLSNNTNASFTADSASFRPGSNVERLCLNPNPALHWNHSRPVTDAITGLTFINQYCALCNNIRLENSTPWPLSINIFSNEIYSRTLGGLDIYKLAVSSGDAEVVYEPPFKSIDPRDTIRQCKHHKNSIDTQYDVSKCNETGLWRHFSLIAQRACEMLDLPIVEMPEERIYRNPFCYYCNHDVLWEHVIRLQSVDKLINSGSNSLSILLDLDVSDEGKPDISQSPTPESVTPQRCGFAHYYDWSKEQCLPVICAPGKIVGKNHTCLTPSGVRSNIFGYTACYLVSGIPGGEAAVTDLADRLRHEPHMIRSESTAIEARIDPHAQAEALSALKPSAVRTTRFKCNACGWLGNSINSSVLLVQAAWASASVLDRSKMDEILAHIPEPLMELLAKTVSASPESSFYVGNLSVVKYPYCEMEKIPIDRSPNIPLQSGHPDIHVSTLSSSCGDSNNLSYQNNCAMDIVPQVKIPEAAFNSDGSAKKYVTLARYLPVNNLLICQHLQIEKDDYILDLQDWSVRLRHCDSTIPASKVSISQRDMVMLMCLEDYEDCKASRPVVNNLDDSIVHGTVLYWLSLISTLISLACCVATLLAYVCLPQLRTTAGINNMVLAFTSFFALSLLSFGASQSENDMLCQVIGMAAHFFWLANTTAMCTATFHMFYALSFPLRFQQYHGREYVLLRMYIGIVVTVPSVLVASTILYSQFKYGTSGYSHGGLCFVSGSLNLYFFYIPILNLVLVNIGMYIFTTIKLQFTSNIASNKTNRNNVLLYSKLSVVTGATWLFGFIFSWTQILFFAYAFTLTLPLLGLFLFMAFVANKRVLEMMREKVRASCVKSTTAGNSSGTVTKSSNAQKTQSTSNV